MIEKETIREVLNNLQEAYNNCDSIILSLSYSNELKSKSFLGGVRLIKSNIILSIINVSQKELREWVSVIEDFNIEYIFIDIEKKLPFDFNLDKKSQKANIEYSNIFAEATERLKNIKIVPWSSTELTGIAAMKVLREELGNNLSGNEITIIGLGAIGYQLALSLTREGVKVNCYTRDYTKGLIKINSINTIKSEYTLASCNLYQSLRTAILSSKVLLECSSSLKTIDESFLEDFQLHKLIIDLGKQAFSDSFIDKIINIESKFIRLDISNSLCEFICSKIFPPDFEKKVPSKAFYSKNINLISGGWKGLPGDIVVDNAKDPKFVLGIINAYFNIDPIYKSFNKWSSLN